MIVNTVVRRTYQPRNARIFVSVITQPNYVNKKDPNPRISLEDKNMSFTMGIDELSYFLATINQIHADGLIPSIRALVSMGNDLQKDT